MNIKDLEFNTLHLATRMAKITLPYFEQFNVHEDIASVNEVYVGKVAKTL